MRKDIRSKCCIIHSCFVDWMYFQFGWTYATLILCRPGLHWCCVVLFWIWTFHEWVCITTCVATYAWQTLWPSGLRRNVKAVVFIGVGSNPIGVMFFTPPLVNQPIKLLLWCKLRGGKWGARDTASLLYRTRAVLIAPPRYTLTCIYPN